jgi:hypothetical protein
VSFFSKIGKHLKKEFKKVKSVVSKAYSLYNSPLGQIGMSFIPGGTAVGLVGKFAKFGKFGKVAGVAARFATKHPRLMGAVNNLRAARHKVPGRTPMLHPTGWARHSNVGPANPFLNGRFQLTHGRKLARLHRYHSGSGVMAAHRRMARFRGRVRLTARRRRRMAA